LLSLTFFRKAAVTGSLCFFTGIMAIPSQVAFSEKAPKVQEAVITDAGLKLLYDEIIHDAKVTDGIVGAGIIHLETGREIYLNRNEHFPMASAVKLPVAVQLMHMVDQGIVHLDSMVTVRSTDLHPGSGVIKNRIVPGRSLSIQYLLNQMLTISDNSATDIILRIVGGPQAVSRRMNSLGIEGISVDRPIYLVLSQCMGITCFDDEKPFSLDLYNRMATKVTMAERLQAHQNYINDARDSSTPEAMARLLEKIWCSNILSNQSSELILGIMGKAHGNSRIKGLLPPDTKVYHKTGTIRGGISDVGIVELPNNAGHIVVTVFVKGGKKSMHVAESAMAQIAKDAYNYFNRRALID
jgi:beta-lactamase class A